MKQENIKNKIYLFSIVILIFFSSCYKEKNDYQTIIIDDYRNNMGVISIEEIELHEEFIHAKYFCIYDSILIVINKSYEDIFFVELYNKDTQLKLNQLFRLGNGPNEMLSALVSLNGNKLIVNDFQKHQIAAVNLDSLLISHNYAIDIYRHFLAVEKLTPLTENNFIYYHPYYFENKEFGISHKIARLHLHIKNSQEELMAEQFPHFTYNINHGEIIFNQQKDSIIFANANSSEIEIYDKEMNLLQKNIFPDDLNAKYTLLDGNEVVFKDRIPLAFTGYCFDDSFIYLLYMGQYLNKFGNLEELTSSIIKIDWKGSFIKYYSGDRFLYNISCGKDENILYATGFDEFSNPILLKIDLI